MQALGLIEVIGYITAVEAADAALKSADIKLLQISKVGSGIMTVMFYGDVSAVESAAQTGGTAAEKIGKVRSVHVIPRADTALEKVVSGLGKVGAKSAKTESAETENKADTTAAHNGDGHIEKMPQTSYTQTYSAAASVPTTDELMQKSNTELRNMAEQMGIATDTVKYARKNDLVQMIIGGTENA